MIQPDNLLEIIPDEDWNGILSDFTGQINTYLIYFSDDGHINGRIMNKTPKDDCLKWVWDDIDFTTQTGTGHWEHDPNCEDEDSGGSGGSSGTPSGGGYNWTPVWGSGDSGNWLMGDKQVVEVEALEVVLALRMIMITQKVRKLQYLINPLRNFWQINGRKKLMIHKLTPAYLKY